ncbi:two-component system response regulator [Nitrospirillum iridis]|uniref:Diguanylate cyclase (GGDEF)-like protein/PAS domain S-box-containing protein n=1 Tax=Nitrospirillum iridis TaxID=765888 RepID=A0A7X0AXH4_9PROT|nr:EAL domain-containing protein [Nitrospirillum iridis]MBB6250900.1 diguanylate cyclase (GGDEF)-like protein/PAS domain S-box-containing protein [Nitrospirillum iridis]
MSGAQEQATSVLIVEDERIIGFNLRLQLVALGYRVTAVAASGDQALKRIHEQRPDVVLMDIHIDGDMDGIDTAARIPDDWRIPVIYLTAYAEQSTLDRAKTTRPFGYLLKPFSERELHATIQMALERRRVEEALRESEKRLSLALDAADMGCWELELPTRRMVRNIRANSILGLPPEEVAGSWDAFLNRIHEEDRHAVDRAFSQAGFTDQAQVLAFRSVLTNGTVRWLKTRAKRFPSPTNGAAFGDVLAAGDEAKVVGVVQDITEQRAVEDELRKAATVFETTHDGILILDVDMTVLAVNPGYCAMTGYTLAQSRGRPVPMVSAQSADFSASVERALRREGHWRGEIAANHRDGHPLALTVEIAAVKDANGLFAHHVMVITDITAIRQTQRKLQHLAHYDHLTNLPNRLLAAERLEQAIHGAMARQQRIGLLFVDIDHFKTVNDTLGHGVGDQLLCAVAQRLRDTLRPDDTVARLGGDEFMVILEGIDRPETAAGMAEKILAALAVPITLEPHELAMSASIGISLFPENGRTRDDLIRAADTAMYAAKDLGRQGYAFYTPQMTIDAVAFMTSLSDLRRGLERGELVLHYQPQVTLDTGAVVGVEALIRWQHPDRGLLGAYDVIPIAEQSGLIIEIGTWVLRQACRQAQAWRDAGLPALRIAVNVSARQFSSGNLPLLVSSILQDTGLPAEALEIEITESTLQSGYRTIKVAEELQQMGIVLAIDDFGTGYSSLGSLKALPITRLKIDACFIRELPDNDDDKAICDAIIAMAQRLRLEVIAEGVETPAQRAFLRERGCSEAQGYLFHRPMPADAIAALFIDGDHRRATE